MSCELQVFFEVCLSMIWFSYYLAIKTPTGSPPPNYKPSSKKSWKRWCKKCKNYKPERAHHCKTCRTCVLKMDHHCPWTMNCVGFGNMPHFMRFLVWVEFTTSFGLWHFVKRISFYYYNANLPAYLFSITELIFVIVLTALDFFVLLTITILLIRCIYAITFGRTQIEGWEMERLESHFHSEKLWEKMRANYRKIHKQEMPKLKSWTKGNHEDNSFSFDDIVFPYDLMSPWDNLASSLGLYTFGCGPGESHREMVLRSKETSTQRMIHWGCLGHQTATTWRRRQKLKMRTLKAG